MSHITLTVPGMNKPPDRYDVTVRVARDDDHPADPAPFAVAASKAASSMNASVISAHTAKEVICVVGVAAPDRPSAVAVALAVVAGALNAEDPHVGRRAEIAITAMIPTVMPMRKKTDKMMAICAAAFIVPPSRRPRE
jgi:hypothetical protein